MSAPIKQIGFILFAIAATYGFVYTIQVERMQETTTIKQIEKSIQPVAIKTENIPLPQSSSALAVSHIEITENRTSYTGLFLVPLTRQERIVVMNTAGTILHSWPFDVYRARLLANCNILVAHGSTWGENRSPWKGLRTALREYTWDGKPVWELSIGKTIHHDFQRLSTGNTLFLARTSGHLPAGAQILGKTLKEQSEVRYDLILESSATGEISWAWDSSVHLDRKACGSRRCSDLSEPRQFRDKFVDWTHSNTVSILPENRWYDAGDSRFRPGNIMLIPRNLWTVVILDKYTGDVTWELQGNALSDGGLIRGHEAHMIEPGLPGAGNILIFDNGLHSVREYSIIREIEPLTQKQVWAYKAPGSFFSHAAGATQRLPQGGTLISDDRGGKRLFEVNAGGAVVWEAHFPQAEPSRAHALVNSSCSKLARLK